MAGIAGAIMVYVGERFGWHEGWVVFWGIIAFIGCFSRDGVVISRDKK